MAGPAVAMSMGQHSQLSSAPAQFQSNRPPPPISSQIPDQSQRGPRPFHRPYQFRPRFQSNKGDDDTGMYDGKRMRKAIHRKTVDYNPSVIKFLQNRVWQRDRRDEHRLQPDSLYSADLVPPPSLVEDPLNCVTTKFVRTSTNKFRCPIFCLTWTPEGRRLVTGASSGEFTLWNGLTFNFETILQAHETAVRAMRWSHSDGWMVTADHAGYVKYWQSNMNNVKMFQAHKEPIRGISFCPMDAKFASCSDDGTVRVWDFMRCHEERILRGHGADVRCVDWHPQKSLLASGSKDNQQPVKLWDPRVGNSLATLHAHKHTVMDLKWHQNGSWMLTASRDHLLKLFDIRNLKEELQTFKGHKREATAIGWHPVHEGLFASGSADGALMFWMVGCDHEVGGMEQAHEGMIWSLAWHPLGHILASGSNDHATKFWTRNRPGDEMRDKYNLNLLPMGTLEQDSAEPVDMESAVPSLPGMGLEHGVAEHLQDKEEKDENELPSIPGLNWEEDSILLKAEEKAQQKKVPYARPVPKMFEQVWSGEIDIEDVKKEQERQSRAKQQAQAFTQQPFLVAQQLLGAALQGALRQQLGQMMMRPGAPPMVMPNGPRGGSMPAPMFLIPGMPPPMGTKVSEAGGQEGDPSAAKESMKDNGDGSENVEVNGNKAGEGPHQTPSSATGSKNLNANSGKTNGPQQDNMSWGVSMTGPPQGQMGPPPQMQVGGPPRGPMGVPHPGQMGNLPQGQMGPRHRGPPPGQNAGPHQGQMGGPPQSQMGGPPQGQMGGFIQGQMGGPPQGQMGGPPHGQMGGPPQGQMGGPPQGQMGGPPQGQMGGPPQGQMGGPPQGQMGGPPHGQMGGPPQGQMTGPPQGHIGGPPQGQSGGPHQAQMGPQMTGARIGGPPQGQMGGPTRMAGPPQAQMGGPRGPIGGPSQGQMGGLQGPMGGPPQGHIRGPSQSQVGGPPRGPMPGSQGQRLPFHQGHGQQQQQMRGGEGGEMDTDERFNQPGNRRGPPPSASAGDMDQDFRAFPPEPQGGQDQDLRQAPGSHGFNPGPRSQRQQVEQPHQDMSYNDYGDMDERLGDSGDYDYRRDSRGGGDDSGNNAARGRAPQRDGFNRAQGGGGFRDSGRGDYYEEEYEEEWDDYGDQGNGFGDEYYDDGYREEEVDYDERRPRHQARKRTWDDGPGGYERGGRRGGGGGRGRSDSRGGRGRGGPPSRGGPRGGWGGGRGDGGSRGRGRGGGGSGTRGGGGSGGRGRGFRGGRGGSRSRGGGDRGGGRGRGGNW